MIRVYTVKNKELFETDVRSKKEMDDIVGKVIMDNTFDDILGRREKDLRSKIAKILF